MLPKPLRTNLSLHSSVKADLLFNQLVLKPVLAPWEAQEKIAKCWNLFTLGKLRQVLLRTKSPSQKPCPTWALIITGALMRTPHCSRFKLWRTILHFWPHGLLAHLSVSVEDSDTSTVLLALQTLSWSFLLQQKPVGVPYRLFCFFRDSQTLSFSQNVSHSCPSPFSCGSTRKGSSCSSNCPEVTSWNFSWAHITSSYNKYLSDIYLQWVVK